MTFTKLGGNDALFTLKAFLSAIMAYYIALRIGLERPYWAIITSYIVAQPLAGAVSSKAIFRLFGTVVGALVAIVLVPTLGNVPELLCLALAAWLGTMHLCCSSRPNAARLYFPAGRVHCRHYRPSDSRRSCDDLHRSEPEDPGDCYRDYLGDAGP